MLSLMLKPVFSSKQHNKAMAQDWARLNTLLPQVSMGDLMEPVQFLVDDQAPCLPAATWCGLLGTLEERFGYPTPSEQEMGTLYDFLTRMYMRRGGVLSRRPRVRISSLISSCSTGCYALIWVGLWIVPGCWCR